ncbi:minor capsid protein [Actinomycetospora aeridis]|uniref:Minor capsid protein n=1 Tax=Actinomycetospora aeridis TaxID=3129231 RepID=A0ABU8N195_9PSEU
MSVPVRWLQPFAALLAAQGFGTWQATGAYPGNAVWPIFLEAVPSKPGRLITVTGYGGISPPHDLEPRVQLRIRGDTDPRTSRGKAEDVFDYLHYLTGGVQLPGGPWLVCAPSVNGEVAPLGGPDENGRFTHITNHALTVSREP